MRKCMRSCYKCGRQVLGKRQNYQYTECGLDWVELRNVIVFQCDCGSIVPEISAVEELHLRIAVDLLSKTSLLSAQEIRFLRTVACYSETKLAKAIGVPTSTVLKWEAGTRIGVKSDRLVRCACFFAMRQECMKDGLRATAIASQVGAFKASEILERIQDAHRGPLKLCIDVRRMSAPLASSVTQIQ
jgi:hypothetical protein